MASDERSTRKNATGETDESTIDDLGAKPVDGKSADQVRGGITMSDLNISKSTDKPSPTL